MRTRSSRFFVVLLHLVGISHHDWMSDYASGIVAVLPWPVALEQVHLNDDRNNSHDDTLIIEGFTSSSSSSSRRNRERPPPQPPIWLQDAADGTCLGPTGQFTECGDATLWFVERRKLSKSRLQLLAACTNRLLFGGHAPQPSSLSSSPSIEDPQTSVPRSTGWIFQVVDRDFETPRVSGTTVSSSSSQGKASHKKRHFFNRQRTKRNTECLESNPKGENSVEVQRCRKKAVWQAKSSLWVVNDNGELQPAENPHLCLAKQGSMAVLANCDVNSTVQFSFFRYRAVPVSVAVAHGGATIPTATASEKSKPSKEESGKDTTSTTPDVSTTIPASKREGATQSPVSAIPEGLPKNRDLAKQHASVTAVHPELRLSTHLRFGPEPTKTTQNVIHILATPLELLSDTNPILLANAAVLNNHAKNNRRMVSTTAPTMPTAKPTVGISTRSRIQTHPYLAAAKNGMWTDPQTGLEYHTDLSKYLGHDRKEKGRHTLTGVGIYRKGYVVKVYGVAFYVTKRDVLADPSFEPYASLTADQLRERPDFYALLQKMGDTNSGTNANLFDRTILLKTNMQLSVETMRSSLSADWSYLTEEAKETLASTSMQSRPADDDMLALIQSPENPSRCSCSQVAPLEYNANPDCCARGTELAFTWLKTNLLEIRLNGRLVTSFPRPDIAAGIFFEYLRYDDPISPELRDNVVLGFPFLLAPLAQVRGVHIGKHAEKRSSAKGNAVLNFFGGFVGSFSATAFEMAEMTKRNCIEAAEHAGSSARAFQEAAFEFGKEVERRRELFTKHAAATSGTALKVLQRDEETIQSLMNSWSRWMSGEPDEPEPELEEEILLNPSFRAPRGRAFGYPLSRWFGEEEYFAPDEIGPMKIHPTINKIILAVVHLYLLLLFIVSFPGSYSTRTRCIIIRKSCSSQDVSDSESESSNGKVEPCRVVTFEPQVRPERRVSKRGGLLGRIMRSPEIEEISSENGATLKKKSLSYFL